MRNKIRFLQTFSVIYTLTIYISTFMRKKQNDAIPENPDGFESNSEENKISPDAVNESSESNAEDSVKFVPPLPGPSVGSVGSAFTSQGFKTSVQAASKLASGDIAGAAKVVGGEQSELLVSDLTNLVTGASEALKILKPIIESQPRLTGGGKGRGTPVSSSDSNAYFNTTRLNLELAPTEVRFESGIKPDCYSPDYHIAELDYAFPLHINLATIDIPDSKTAAYEFYAKAVLLKFRNLLQRNVSFHIKEGQINEERLNGYFRAILYSLQVYYALTRFLVYGLNPLNKNEALLKLRESINLRIGDKYLLLKRALEGCPIPPNLNTLAFYFCQIYLTSEVPGSPAIMFSPVNFTNGNPDWDEVEEALNLLNDPKVLETMDIIGKAVPSWYDTKIHTGISNPLHDPGFMTMWSNAPYLFNLTQPKSVEVKGPVIADYDTSIRYNTYTNNLDGAIYALTSAYNSQQKTWSPSLIKPFGARLNDGTTTSRLSFVTDGNGKYYFGCSFLDYRCSISRLDTYTGVISTDPICIPTLKSGSERVEGVSGRSITNTSRTLLEWCIDFGTLPTRVDKNLVGKPVRGGSSPIANPLIEVDNSTKWNSSKSKPKGKKRKGGGNKASNSKKKGA